MNLIEQNARNLYIRGIQEGKLEEVLTQYMGETYTQHSTGVPDGKEGFAAFFTDFFKRHHKREMTIVRSLVEAPFVFLHIHQKLDNGAAEWITADIFRADQEGKIVEHWDVIEAYQVQEGKPDPIYGEGDQVPKPKGEKNKELVQEWMDKVLAKKDKEVFERLIGDSFINHSQRVGASKAAMWSEIETGMDIQRVSHLLAEGDLVVLYAQVVTQGQEYAQFEIYRLDHGQIVERWSVREPMPLEGELTNSGKF